MLESLNLCMGCMSEKIPGEKVCMECGYAEGTPYLPSYLAPSTILNDRYIVGRVLRYNGESALYIGFDMVAGSKVWIREYMPDTLCERIKGSPVIRVNQNNLAQYKALMSEFTELNKMLAKMRTLGHIDPALDLFAQNNTTYVVLKSIEGVTLKRYLQDHAGELEWSEVRELFIPLINTINLVHGAGVIHRGICPENIWVTEEGLVLSGFCIAAERTGNSELASELYSGYAAPEQYSSNSWQGTWTDVYGICAVMYRALTGCMPSDAVSRMGNDTLSEPAKVNGNISAGVSRTIMNGMKLTAEARIQTMTELVTALSEEPEQPANDYEDEYIPPKPKKKKKKKRGGASPIMVGVLTLAVGLVIAMFALFFLEFDRDEPIATTPMQTEPTEETTTTPVSETTADSSGEYVMSDFRGRNFELISQSSTYMGIINFVPEYVFSDEVERGVIMEQDVEPNTYYSAGQTLNVTVSNGPAKVALPDYIGIKEDEYFRRLDNAGITYIREVVDDPEVAFGYISRTSKDDGSMIDRENGEAVIVYVSINSSTAPTSDTTTTAAETTPAATGDTLIPIIES